MTAAHTPGPWHVGVGGNFHSNRVWTEDMRPVAGLCSMGTAPADIDPEAQANARLIAAAPELLDLARNIGGFDDGLLLSADLNMYRAVLREFREQARAAIAQAELPETQEVI